MTVTWARQQVVDFVRPFQNLGMSVIAQRSSLSAALFPTATVSTQRRMLSAWQPMEPSLWATTFALFVVVSRLLLKCSTNLCSAIQTLAHLNRHVKFKMKQLIHTYKRVCMYNVYI